MRGVGTVRGVVRGWVRGVGEGVWVREVGEGGGERGG